MLSDAEEKREFLTFIKDPFELLFSCFCIIEFIKYISRQITC
ncbi:hypothetical protein HMPREF1611_04563 [Escherichia coli 908573]|nr:hypothetical protein HMPREF1611_04563 [Escherichia coli 908573]